MKKIILSAVIILLFCIHADGKIWRVNNNPGVSADFTTAQAANDASQVLAGDTIHLEPSIYYYGNNLTTNKRLVWISTGFFLNENPGNQFSNTPGTIASHLYINPGSEGSVFSIAHYGGNVYISAASVTLSRCLIYGAIDINAQNITVTQCYQFTSLITLNTAISTNAIITNNILPFAVNMAYNTCSAIISNNIFRNFQQFVYIYNSVFQNNIIIGNSGVWNFINSSVSYNLSQNPNFPTGNNNQSNVDMYSVFLNQNGSIDKDFILKPGSPAIGSGFGGTDMGVFGGNTPYKLALQPAVPAITNIIAPASNDGNTIQVTFSAKSNN